MPLIRYSSQNIQPGRLIGNVREDAPGKSVIYKVAANLGLHKPTGGGPPQYKLQLVRADPDEESAFIVMES